MTVNDALYILDWIAYAIRLAMFIAVWYGFAMAVGTAMRERWPARGVILLRVK
jgi:hypothetical protein